MSTTISKKRIYSQMENPIDDKSIKRIDRTQIENFYSKLVEQKSIDQLILECDDQLDINRFAVYFLGDRVLNFCTTEGIQPLMKDDDIVQSIENFKQLKDERVQLLIGKMKSLFEQNFNQYLCVLNKVVKWFANMGTTFYHAPENKDIETKYENGYYFHWILSYRNSIHMKGHCLSVLLICLIPYLDSVEKKIETQKCILNAIKFKNIKNFSYFMENPFQLDVLFYIIKNMDMSNASNQLKFERIVEKFIGMDIMRMGCLVDKWKPYMKYSERGVVTSQAFDEKEFFLLEN